jgi:lysozyme
MAVGPKVRAMAVVLTLSASGLAFLKGNEDTRLVPYLDSVGVPTVCTGHTAKVDMSRYYTPAECDSLLAKDTHWSVAAVRKGITVPIYQSQFDALVDFCFNVGAYACRTSTLFAKVNAKDDQGAAQQFLRWKFADSLDCSVRKNNCYGVWQRRLDAKALFESDL